MVHALATRAAGSVEAGVEQLVREQAVEELHGDRALSDRGGHAFDGAVSDVSGRQHAGHAGFEREWTALQRPVGAVRNVASR